MQTLHDKLEALPRGSTRGEFISVAMAWLPTEPSSEEIEHAITAVATVWGDRRALAAEMLTTGDVTRIYLMAARKAWHHNVPDGWKEVAFERFDYVECGIYEKPTAELTDADHRDWVKYHSERPNGWIEPMER